MTAELEIPPLRPKFSAVRRARRGPHSHNPERKEEIDTFVRTCTTRIILKLRQSGPQESTASRLCGGLQTRAR